MKAIIFSGEMVKAILEGRKTQTRRILKTKKSDLRFFSMHDYCGGAWVEFKDNTGVSFSFNCPYGKVGDIVDIYEEKICSYKGSKKAPVLFKVDDCRIEYTDIRVERLQEISEEGVQKEGSPFGFPDVVIGSHTNIELFVGFWNSLHGEKYHWNDNPWVWVITFRRLYETR